MATRSSFPRSIGVIHLPPLAGAPGAGLADPASILYRAGDRAIREAKTLEKAGFEALIIENFGDVPFYKETVPPETVASLSVITAAVREAVGIPVGINVLRNDAHAALAIAAVTGCSFIRVNVLSGVVASDQGMIEGRAAGLLRERARLNTEVAVFADVQVKHARSLSGDEIELAIEEAALRAGAQAVILTGSTTGRPVNATELEAASRAARAASVPLYIGSGATPETVGELLRSANGVIVGSALRVGGKAGAPLDAKRIKSFTGSLKTAARSRGRGRGQQSPRKKKKASRKVRSRAKK